MASDTPASFIEAFFKRMPEKFIERPEIEAKSAKIVADSYKFFKSSTIKPLINITQSNNMLEIMMINNDMPFIVDSVCAELSRQGIEIDILAHPILRVERSAQGSVINICDDASGEAESLVYIGTKNIEIDVSLLKQSLSDTILAVQMVDEDQEKITQKLKQEITSNKKSDTRSAEITDFANWLLADNFIFFGFEEYTFNNGAKFEVIRNENERFGMFRLPETFSKPRGLFGLDERLRKNATRIRGVEFSKSARKSLVHRNVPMDYVVFKRLNDEGEVIGEARFVGLFSAKSSFQSVREIPILRQKIARVFISASLEPDSFDEKNLQKILETYPRDELLQTSNDDLTRNASEIMALETQAEGVKVLLRKDLYERYISALIFIPKDSFTTESRRRIQNYLEQELKAKFSTHFTQVTDSPHARINMLFTTIPGEIPELDSKKLEAGITATITNWMAGVADILKTRMESDKAHTLLKRYTYAFPPEYSSLYTPEIGATDIINIEKCIDNPPIYVELEPQNKDSGRHKVIVYNQSTKDMALSDIVPVLENLGAKVFHEKPFVIKPSDKETHVVREIEIEFQNSAALDFQTLQPIFENSLTAILRGDAENDSFNRMVSTANIDVKRITILRFIAAYLKQIKLPYSQDYIARTLAKYPAATALLTEAFRVRFDPAFGGDRTTEFTDKIKELEQILSKLTSVDEDRIIRAYTTMLPCMLRTNFYQPDEAGNAKQYISVKIDSAKVHNLPLPRPYVEIFVYSKRFEGIHLRGGKVARGGLRWSDRPEDFRTEILGLMKAQFVKNSVIVPTGAKGGFVLKTATSTREELMAEGVACYKNFLRALLDITDNVSGGKVTPPLNVVRHDGDDSYLVVAADKGTATFSDYANSISAEYSFWLGDAFASGGSVGYDHKKMGITAKGGWISVVRHFREMGIDISRENFTAVGIGDMAGDVFGNGMLLSNTMQLIAAFNHMHIFIDPTPDAAKSFVERKRLFELPRSSWADYNSTLISAGGGIFERSAKNIPVSKEMRAALGISGESITPDELIRAILSAPVDLLWNGGIGTYIKSEREGNDQVGDKANDNVRMNGKDLRCKIVGEGGNLGCTQLGRIEYAGIGGRINTDAIDNSAGVDCSDHEVNIKIAFSSALSDGSLTKEKRDEILSSMTDEVGALVLEDNRLQTQAISIAEKEGSRLVSPVSRLIRKLEASGLLNRKLEFLPTDEELENRRLNNIGLSRPELAVLLAYSKIDATHQVLSSNLPDAKHLEDRLIHYFPARMQADFRKLIVNHQLRREIIATVTVNDLINKYGATFFNQIVEETGQPLTEAIRAAVLATDVLKLGEIWDGIEALDGGVDLSLQFSMFRDVRKRAYQATVWILGNYPSPINIDELYKSLSQDFSSILSAFGTEAPERMKQEREARITAFTARNISTAFAERIARLEETRSALEVVKAAQITKTELKTVSRLYLQISERINLSALVNIARAMKPDTHLSLLAVNSLVSDIYGEARTLTTEIITHYGENGVIKWLSTNQERIDSYDVFFSELSAAKATDIPLLVMAIKRLQSLKVR